MGKKRWKRVLQPRRTVVLASQQRLAVKLHLRMLTVKDSEMIQYPDRKEVTDYFTGVKQESN